MVYQWHWLMLQMQYWHVAICLHNIIVVVIHIANTKSSSVKLQIKMFMVLFILKQKLLEPRFVVIRHFYVYTRWHHWWPPNIIIVTLPCSVRGHIREYNICIVFVFVLRMLCIILSSIMLTSLSLIKGKTNSCYRIMHSCYQIMIY